MILEGEENFTVRRFRTQVFPYYDMQSVCTKSSSRKSTEAKGFCASRQCQIKSEELIDLRRKVADLEETVTSLENVVQMKDMRLQNMQQDNERLSAELKKQHRCVRTIKQQLDDERFFYEREKDYFNSEMQRRRTKCMNGSSRLQQQRRELEDERESLEVENKSLRGELNDKVETTYNLCIKFLRMKYAKDSLRQKFDRLLKDHLQVMSDMMEKLDEAREELNIIVSEKFQEPLPLSKAKFLQVVQRNARLVHENATLKVQIQQLTLNIEKLKYCSQKPKSINVDAKIIAKLAAQSKKRCSRESAKRLPFRFNENETEISASLTKPLDFRKAGDADVMSKIESGYLESCTNNKAREIQTEETGESRTERARSAPEIRLPEVQPSSTITWTESSIESRDASTNT